MPDSRLMTAGTRLLATLVAAGDPRIAGVVLVALLVLLVSLLMGAGVIFKLPERHQGLVAWASLCCWCRRPPGCMFISPARRRQVRERAGTEGAARWCDGDGERERLGGVVS